MRWSLVSLGAVLSLLPLAVQSDVLRYSDGDLELRGEIIGYDDETITIRSTIGTITLPLADVTCTGDGCPPAADEAPTPTTTATATASGDFSVDIGSAVPRGLIEELMAGAQAATSPGEGSEIQLAAGGSNDQTVRLLIDTTGSASVSFMPAAPNGVSSLAGVGDDTIRVIGLDALVVVAARELNLRSVEIDDLAAIYSGTRTSWRGLSSRSGAVTAVLRESERADFEAMVLRPRGLSLSPAVQVLPEGADVVETLKAAPGAIGITGLSGYDGAKAVAITGSCGLSHPPDLETIALGEYPLMRLLVAQSQSETASLPDLFDYVMTVPAQEVVAAHDIAALVVEPVGSDRVDDWLGNSMKLAELTALSGGAETQGDVSALAQTIGSAKRLSPTFYGSGIDAAALGHFERLAALLASGRYDGDQVIFAGFSSARADGSTQPASQQAAEAVLDAFLAASPAMRAAGAVSFSAAGFGAIAPHACDDTAEGRYLNNRVEVWVRPGR